MAPSHPPSLLDRSLRLLLGGVHGLMKLGWRVRRPRTFGAHAVALTPAGKVVLVRLRYADGWRLPGGGRKEHEAADKAVLRELREEIGLTAHGEVQLARELEESSDFKRDLASLFIVRDVRYTPRRWSWEIEAITESALDTLPPDLSGRAAGWLEALRDKL
jgi:8-oxo-dGTP pyrophosphatase MutT (NUDIX family)